MSTFWIVHRSSRERAALARLAGVPSDTPAGTPGDTAFDSAPTPDAILVGLVEDWELELEMAHAQRGRAPHALWILLGAPGDEERALRAFDTVAAEFLAWPPSPTHLRRRLHRLDSLTAPSLSERANREVLTARFSRWFADLELPEVLRALDPRLSDASLLILGEPGTGRGVLARYVHAFGGTSDGALVHIPCQEDLSLSDLYGAVATNSTPGDPLAIWLEDVERLAPLVQRRLAGWIEYGLPSGPARAGRVRWIGTATIDGAETLEEDLRRPLADLQVMLPPLRSRPHLVEAVASETARAWCAARHAHSRRFGEDALAVMEEYPWPGNLRELEAVVVQTLATGAADPIGADELRIDGVAFAPIVPTAEPSAPVSSKNGSERPSQVAPVAPFDRIDDSETEDALAALELGTEPEAEPWAQVIPEDDSDRGTPTQLRTPLEEAAPPAHASAGRDALARLAGALSHEVRNPLATIRTFAELLPERFEDPEFRDRFAETVKSDVDRIDGLVERLGDLAALDEPRREAVDLSAMLEELLDERRQLIRDRRLLVLKELDANRPLALCDAAQLRFALDALLGKSLELVPERGDVYLASRHHPAAGTGGPSVRALLRFHVAAGSGAAVPGVTLAENSLEFLIAEIAIRAQGGSLAIANTEGEETVLVIDLPSPD